MANKIDIKDFRVKPKQRVRLNKWPTHVDAVYDSKEHYAEMLAKHRANMAELQALLYGSNNHSLLLIFQAMDAAGKDGAIKHVMSGVDPQGTQVFSFKQPSAEELDHDFLWRTNKCLPERGRIGIFNRSYYEEVLVVRVHPEYLKGQHLPPESAQGDELWKQRFESINDMELHLHRSGTRIVKFYLHVSKEEQRKRLLARIDDPSKNWKFSSADVKERELWPAYMSAYEACLSATSTKHAPWYVIPADDKENARLIVSKIIVSTLRDLEMSYPATDAARKKELQAIRGSLALPSKN
jgi:PPK2 family polyphosphate:nucleotide phosphotransferase